MIEYKNIRYFVENELEQHAGFDENGKFDRDEMNRAALAELRRVLGKPINKAFSAFQYVAKWTKNVEEGWDMECFYLVASLFAVYQQGQFENDKNRLSWHHEENLFTADRNFGASFRRFELEKRKDESDAAKKNGQSKSIEKRFSVLLNSRSADLPVRLRQAVLLLASREIRIDWVRLLEDLLRWKRNETAFYVQNRKISPQRSWAQSFYKIEENKETQGEK
jgi:CRISPR type I-E-associated protein CasB/Cse2